MGGCFSYRLKLVRESDEFPNPQALSTKLTRFSFKSMEKATNNFDPSGEMRRDHRFSKSYKGILDDGSQVEVVVQTSMSVEFTSVINIMSGVKHKNLVELIGYCIEGDHRILVQEFVGEKGLDQLLLSDAVVLDWPTRVSICQGIALGIDYLHNAISPLVVHRNIKPSNILMDCNFNPKIVGFYKSCLLEEGVSHHSGNVVGTLGYIDPVAPLTNRFSEKSDVYAFGITLLEIINGDKNRWFRVDDEAHEPILRDSAWKLQIGIRAYFARLVLEIINRDKNRDKNRWFRVDDEAHEPILRDWAWKLQKSGRISEFVDQKLSEFSEDGVKRLVIVALSCLQCPPNHRPSMADVRVMLSDSYDYNNIVLNPPVQLNSQQQQMSSDIELSVNISSDEDTSFANVTRLSLQSLEMATNGFNPSREIRHYGFSKSYKGTMDDGIEVVVKVYNTDDRDIDFASMIKIMSDIAHENVVKLIGYCIENGLRMLVHEFVGDYSLDQLLFSDSWVKDMLDWPKRVSICRGIACALDYLHNECSPRVVLRDVKTSNILIDNNFNPKIVDFEASCLLDEGESDHSDERYSCLDPKYRTSGRYSAKTDVYAFGIALLEIINGSKVWLFSQGHRKTNLVDRALKLWAIGKIPEIVDPTLSEFSEAEVICLVNFALSCVQSNPHLRPNMSEVKQMLPSSVATGQY